MQWTKGRFIASKKYNNTLYFGRQILSRHCYSAEFIVVAKEVQARNTLAQKAKQLLNTEFTSVRGHIKLLFTGTGPGLSGDAYDAKRKR